MPSKNKLSKPKSVYEIYLNDYRGYSDFNIKSSLEFSLKSEQEIIKGIDKVLSQLFNLTYKEVINLPINFKQSHIFLNRFNGHAHGVRIRKDKPESLIYEFLDYERVFSNSYDYSVIYEINLEENKVYLLKVPDKDTLFSFLDYLEYFYSEILTTSQSDEWVKAIPQNQKIIQNLMKEIRVTRNNEA